MFDPTTARLATDLTRRELMSARPGAPVVDDGRRPALAGSRAAFAAALHGLARRIEPTDRRRAATRTYVAG